MTASDFLDRQEWNSIIESIVEDKLEVRYDTRKLAPSKNTYLFHIYPGQCQRRWLKDGVIICWLEYIVKKDGKQGHYGKEYPVYGNGVEKYEDFCANINKKLDEWGDLTNTYDQLSLF